MKHHIEHENTIDSFKYTVINEEYFQKAVDFFFDVFLKGNLNYIFKFQLWIGILFAFQMNLLCNHLVDTIIGTLKY